MNTCMPGFHKVWCILEISTVKKKVNTTQKNIVLHLSTEMALVYYGQLWKILKLQYYFQRLLENFLFFVFQLRFSAEAHALVRRIGAITFMTNTEVFFQVANAFDFRIST